ncbi:MAG: hypothetical protein V8T36_10665 [Ruthenibacterium lactatiformans]
MNGLKTQVPWLFAAIATLCVDQMVLESGVHGGLHGSVSGRTHGVRYSRAFVQRENLPNFNPGDVLIHGHTHVRACGRPGRYFFLEPRKHGAFPKGDGVHSYMVYEDGVFTTKDMDGAVLETLDIRRLTHGKDGRDRAQHHQKIQETHLASVRSAAVRSYRLVNAGDRILAVFPARRTAFCFPKCMQQGCKSTATFRLNWTILCLWTRATARKTAP